MDPRAAADFVSERLRAAADPVKAPQMQAYMKTEMPFYGVQKDTRDAILRALRDAFDAPQDQSTYEALVRDLWGRAHREEKYLAVRVARAYTKYVTASSLPLYEELIRDGAWWDFVDEIASHLIGTVLRRERESTSALLRRWIDDDDLWIRRAAILAQLRHRDATDAEMLFEFCERRAHETEFFIRKAIGWALRQYSYTDPDAVRDWLETHWDDLAGLTRREARRRLDKVGLSPRVD